MNARQRDTEHVHVWRWLPRAEYVALPESSALVAANVECESCGARTWAHGHGPTNPPPPATATPTTDRS